MEAKKNIFFNSRNKNLFGSFSYPENQSDLGAVIIHPFAEEKILSYRGLLDLAAKLSECGITCLRFDFMGHGDSEGAFEDSTMQSRIDNINDAIEFFMEETGIDNIILIGFRFGATLGMLAANSNEKIRRLVMMAPIINGEKYIKTLLRSNLSYQMATFKKIIKTREQLIEDLTSGTAVNIDGYLISQAIYEQMCSIDLCDIDKYDIDETLIIHMSKFGSNIPKEYCQFIELLKTNNVSTTIETLNDPNVWKTSEIYEMNLSKSTNIIAHWINKQYIE